MTTASRFRLKSARRGPGKCVSRCPASSAAASLEAAAAAGVLAGVLGEEELEEALEEELAGLEVDMGVQSSAEGMGVQSLAEGMGVTEVILAEGSMGYPSAAVAAMEGLLVVGDFTAAIILTWVTKAAAAAEGVTMTLAVQAMDGNIAIKYF